MALLASSLIPLFRDRPQINFTHPRPPSPLLDVWARWDSEWYLAIAEGGYPYEIRDPLQRARHPHHPTAGFFPLYPCLIRILPPLAGSGVAAGWWVSNLALPGFLLLQHRILREDTGPAAARRGIAYFLFLLASLFCSAVYAESLFLLLCATCPGSLRRGLTGGAAAAAFAESLTRPAGVFLALPPAWEAWKRSRRSPPAAGARAAGGSGLGPPLGWTSVPAPTAG